MLGATSFAPVAYFMYQNWLFSKWAKEQASGGGFVCGTGIVALLALCIAVSAVFSLLAALLGFIGYLRIDKPRPGKRLLEIALVGMGFIVAIVAGLSVI